VPGPDVEGSSIIAVTVTQESDGVMPATSAQPLGAVGDPGVRETRAARHQCGHEVGRIGLRVQLQQCHVHFLQSTHTHTRLTALCPGLPRGPVPIWVLPKQETVSGSGISWAICKSAPPSRQTTMPAPHHSVFYRPVAFLPANQQCQSTEGKRSSLCLPP